MTLKNILLKDLDEKLVHKLTELKGKYCVDSWEELVAKLVELEGKI